MINRDIENRDMDHSRNLDGASSDPEGRTLGLFVTVLWESYSIARKLPHDDRRCH